MTKKQKKISRASKRRLLVFGTMSAMIIVYFLFSTGLYIYKIYSLKSQEKNLTEYLNNLQHDEKILSTDMEKLKDPDYLAKYARETYRYSKDDEVIIQRQKQDKTAEEDKKLDFSINEQYILISCFIVLVLIIIYIIRKNKKAKKTKNKKKKR